MGQTNIVLVVSSIIGSGFLGVIISIIYYRRHENYLRKLEVLRDYAGYRHTLAESRDDLDSSLFFKALNQISVAFRSKDVKDALQNLHDNITRSPGGMDLDLLVRLYRAMCKELHIKTENFTDQFFLRPFTPRKPRP